MHRLIWRLKEHEFVLSYVLIFVITLGTVYIFFEHRFFQNVNLEDTRYFLSALAQVEGAIVAIYTTMVLVGIQLTLKVYSEVVLDIYRKNYEFWMVFTSYLFSIILTLTLLQNVSNLNSIWLSIAYLWGVFNLLILSRFIYGSFILLNPKVLIDRFLKIYAIENISALWKIYRIASTSLQSQNVDVVAYILEKIHKYIQDDFSKKVNNISMMYNDVFTTEKQCLEELKLEELKSMLRFIEDLTHMLRSLTLYTIDQFKNNRITQNEATWVLNMIRLTFRTVFVHLTKSLYPLYFVPKINENLKNTLSQCLLELEIIIEGLQEAPQAIKDEELRRFLDVLPNNFIKFLKVMGCEHLVERAERLQELAKEDFDSIQ